MEWLKRGVKNIFFLKSNFSHLFWCWREQRLLHLVRLVSINISDTIQHLLHFQWLTLVSHASAMVSWKNKKTSVSFHVAMTKYEYLSIWHDFYTNIFTVVYSIQINVSDKSRIGFILTDNRNYINIMCFPMTNCFFFLFQYISGIRYTVVIFISNPHIYFNSASN